MGFTTAKSVVLTPSTQMHSQILNFLKLTPVATQLYFKNSKFSICKQSKYKLIPYSVACSSFSFSSYLLW
jgi:hypothetical protein